MSSEWMGSVASVEAVMQSMPVLAGIVVVVYGAIVGSFLNVVIHRLPLMMEREFQAECAANGLDGGALSQPVPERFNLAHPGSRCPGCGEQIRVWHNIPLLSYLWLKGRCAHCRQMISPRYFAVELLTVALSVVVWLQFGVTLKMAAVLVLTWALLAAAFIDAEHQLLPDSITQPLLWMGLLLNLHGLFAPLPASVLGAAFGYLSLWSLYQVGRVLTGKEGLGYGDFKLLAVFGAWMGWRAVPLVVFGAAWAALIVGAALMLLRRQDRGVPLAFGPYLAVVGWGLVVGGPALQAFLYSHF